MGSHHLPFTSRLPSGLGPGWDGLSHVGEGSGGWYSGQG